MNLNLAGVIAFIASESILFLAFVAAYVAYRDTGIADARAHLDVGVTGLFSVLLFASSWTVARVRGTGSRADRAWLAVTMLLGAAFLAGQGREYAALLAHGIAPWTGTFASAFFGLTGLHGLHVLVGLGALGTLLVTAMLRPNGVRPVAYEGVSMYWHFVDAVWVVVFSVVYLWSLV